MPEAVLAQEGSIPSLPPGTLRRDVPWVARGRVLFCQSLTKSVTIFALRGDSPSVVDCIARVQDGWRSDELAALTAELSGAAADDGPVAVVEGYPERLPVEQGASTCLHLQRLLVAGQAWQVAADVEAALPPPRALSSNPRNNDSRFAAFAEFLLDRFGGHAALSAGCGVLDVAGGSGGLAFELAVRRQVPCVVVDPRELRLTATQRLALQLRREVCDALAPHVGTSPLASSTSRKFQSRPITQLQELFDSGAAVARGGGEAAGAVAAAARACSVVVGLHPDQALDHIVEAALALQKPFAVAPCCVFWKHGRNALRRTPQGQIVKTYDQLCEYVACRAPGIREAALPFHGLNRVLYWHPPALGPEGAPATASPARAGPDPDAEPERCRPCSPLELD